jgi:hypothetical protein
LSSLLLHSRFVFRIFSVFLLHSCMLFLTSSVGEAFWAVGIFTRLLTFYVK